MAVAHAKFTGELGVCLATGGPGATHLITGLYDAKLDHMPVLAICGQAETTVRGGELPAGAQPRPHVRRRRRICSGGQRTRRSCRTSSTARSGSRSRGARRRWSSCPRTCRSSRSRRRGARTASRAPARAIRGRSSCRPKPTCARPPKSSMPAKRSRSWSAPARPTPPMKSIAVAETLGAGVAKALLGKSGAARRSAVRHRRDRPARHQAELRPDERLRHVADRSAPASPGPSSCPRTAPRARSRSTSTRRCCRCAIRAR